jgi:hypothetical protein
MRQERIIQALGFDWQIFEAPVSELDGPVAD